MNGEPCSGAFGKKHRRRSIDHIPCFLKAITEVPGEMSTYVLPPLVESTTTGTNVHTTTESLETLPSSLKVTTSAETLTSSSRISSSLDSSTRQLFTVVPFSTEENAISSATTSGGTVTSKMSVRSPEGVSDERTSTLSFTSSSRMISSTPNSGPTTAPAVSNVHCDKIPVKELAVDRTSTEVFDDNDEDYSEESKLVKRRELNYLIWQFLDTQTTDASQVQYAPVTTFGFNDDPSLVEIDSQNEYDSEESKGVRKGEQGSKLTAMNKKLLAKTWRIQQIQQSIGDKDSKVGDDDQLKGQKAVEKARGAKENFQNNNDDGFAEKRQEYDYYEDDDYLDTGASPGKERSNGSDSAVENSDEIESAPVEEDTTESEFKAIDENNGQIKERQIIPLPNYHKKHVRKTNSIDDDYDFPDDNTGDDTCSSGEKIEIVDLMKKLAANAPISEDSGAGHNLLDANIKVGDGLVELLRQIFSPGEKNVKITRNKGLKKVQWSVSDVNK